VSRVFTSAVHEESYTYDCASIVPGVTGCSIVTAPLLSREEVSYELIAA
jgi:hypothetical protein